MSRFKDKKYSLRLTKGATYYIVGDEGSSFSPVACHLVNSDYAIRDYNQLLVFEAELELPLALMFDAHKYFKWKMFSKIILIKDVGAMISPATIWPVYLHLCLPKGNFNFSAKIIQPNTLIWKGKCILCRSKTSAMRAWKMVLDNRESSARNLEVMLKDENPKIRINVASGLAFSGDEESLAELRRKYALEKHSAVKRVMRISIEKLTRRLNVERALR